MDPPAVPVAVQLSNTSPDPDDNEHLATITSTTGRENIKNPDNNATALEVSEPSKPKAKRSWRFWAIFASLSITGLLSAVEGTVTTTALPTIVADLGGGELYIWAANGYFLTSTAVQPLYGQTSNIFGRRWLLLSAVAIFTLGSGISGGASSMGMLIAGRSVQGIGGGGINMLIELIVCDLVPLRERGNFIGLLFGFVTIGAALGPFIGGIIVQTTTWRWVFYLNLPIGGAALVCLFLFLQVGYKKEMTVMQKMKRVDWLGNAIFVAAVTAVLLALTWGGTIYAWSSFHIILPLVLGFLGFGLFQIYESSKFCKEPTMPPQLYANRTSVTAFGLTFIHAMLTYWVLYFLPVYFQSVLLSTPARSGVQLLPTILGIIPFAIISGLLLTKLGRYRPFHHIGFALMTVGFGLFTILDPHSSTAVWVIFQIVSAAGTGLVASVLLPATQASLSEADTATATGTWSFIRSFGAIWGVSIPSAVFNNQCSNLASRISDPSVRGFVSGGRAYEHATKLFIASYRGALRQEIISVYSDSLKLVWQVAIAIAGLAFLLVIIEKEVKLRTELDTEFGITDEKAKKEEPQA